MADWTRSTLDDRVSRDESEHLVCESNSVLVKGGFGGGELAFERVTLLIDYFDYFYGFEEAITKFFPVLAINV